MGCGPRNTDTSPAHAAALDRLIHAPPHSSASSSGCPPAGPLPRHVAIGGSLILGGVGITFGQAYLLSDRGSPWSPRVTSGWPIQGFRRHVPIKMVVGIGKL